MGIRGSWKRLRSRVVLIVALVTLSAVIVVGTPGRNNTGETVSAVHVVDEVRAAAPAPTQATCGAGAYVSGDLVGDANPAEVYAAQCRR
jgi:hypothetical protein